jgi:hypothetical protein
MRQKVLGLYPTGCDHIQLVIREGYGGEFWINPGDIKNSRIKIGADYEGWFEIMAILLHEIEELLRQKEGCRYTNDGHLSSDNGNYYFFYDHLTLSNLATKEAIFLSNCLPDLATAWKQWKKDNKKEIKK